MKCFICEKVLTEPVSKDSEQQIQYYDAGEIQFSFCYGSRFDFIGNPNINEGPRALRLSGCPKIRAAICDDCFEAKSHLVVGDSKDCKTRIVPLER